MVRIEGLAAKVQEARRVQEDTIKDIDSLCWAILQDESHGAAVPTPMRELVRLREPNVEVIPTASYHFAGVYCFGRGVFVGQRKMGTEFAYHRLTRLRRQLCVSEINGLGRCAGGRTACL